MKGGDGTLRAVITQEPASLNPNIGPDELAMIVGQNLFGKLVTLAADGSIVPDLAERWEESADGLTYTFHLRQDVRWHDGRPFTAEDVRQTFVRLPLDSANKDLAARVAGVEIVDPGTVAVRLREPWAAFIASLGWFGTSMLPAHVYGHGSWRDHPANMQPIGTGPFRFRSWTRGERIVLDKNPMYVGQGPYVDAVEYILVPDHEEAVRLIVDGKADVLIGRPPANLLAELSRTPGVRVLREPGDGRAYIGFNLRRRPFADVRVRRAINQAIDRRALVQRALFGAGAPALGFYTPTVGWAYNGAARVPPHDLALARRLLRSAVPGGFPATLVCMAAVRDYAEEVASQLGAIGVRVRVEVLPPQEYFQRLLVTRDFDMAITSGSQGPDPDNLAARFATTGSQQFMGYSNPELDERLAEGARQSDVVLRAKAYHRAQEILADDLPIAPLTESVRITLFRDSVRGLPRDGARALVADHVFRLVRLRAGAP
jgi:peptide/nickel transport system substrate-binding protein